MEQPARQTNASPAERRQHPRRPAAYAYWLHVGDDQERLSAWMYNLSTGGAAFLVDAETPPEVKQRVAFAEMHSANTLVAEQVPPLPPFGRVVRVEEGEGTTCRVAVCFETNIPAVLDRQCLLADRIQLRPQPPGPVAPPAPRPDDVRLEHASPLRCACRK